MQHLWSIKIPNMKVVATWIWWTTLLMAGAAALNDYPLVRFTTQGATEDSYNAFVKEVRNRLSSGAQSHQVLVMRDPGTVSAAERFLLVELTNQAGDSITLAIDVTDAYLVAYRAAGQSYFFSDAPSPTSDNLFTDTQRNTLRYSGRYGQLERFADATRSKICLGIQALDSAITNLYHWTTVVEQNRARGFLVCIQMISEAARISYIQQNVAASFRRSREFRPNPAVLRFENTWGSLSTAIQTSGESGVFRRQPETPESPGCSFQIRLDRPDGTSFYVDRVTPALVANLGVLKFASNPSPGLVLPRVIRSVVDDGEENENCKTSEPTIRISGRNGLCADVKNGYYNNGDPIILWPCKSNTDTNQLWTLKKDGTIRSNGKCLTTFANEPGKYMMIYDCPEPATDRTIWELSDDGSITNPSSGLALTTASSGESGTELNVNTNNYAAKQGWVASNITEPLVTPIAGFKDLCLQAERDNTAWLGECDYNNYEQQWAIYPDGSIRPHQNRDRCLACEDYKASSIVLIESCTGSSNERWLFRNDNTIENLLSGLVMDVRQSDLSLKQIITYPPTGNPNQKWFMTL